MFHIYVSLLHSHLCKNMEMNFDLSLSFCKFQIIYWVHSSHGYRSNTSYPCYTPKQLLLHFHLPENGIIGGVDPQPNLTNLQFGLVQSDL